MTVKNFFLDIVGQELIMDVNVNQEILLAKHAHLIKLKMVVNLFKNILSKI